MSATLRYRFVYLFASGRLPRCSVLA